LGAAQIVVSGSPAGGHSTRTIIFDNMNRLYLQSGSGSNVDSDPSRSVIRRWPNVTNLPLTWATGEIFASGMRNEVGLTFDSQGRLFGVENGRDDLSRADLGGDIHADNPAEEVNMFSKAGLFYGYPYCWSQFSLPKQSTAPGTQYADPTFQPGTTDAWCRNLTNVVPPVFPMQAHMAPLSIMFFEKNSYPAAYWGAFVAQHGSWDRPVPVGYRVDLLSLDGNGLPKSSQVFLAYNGTTAKDPQKWPHRFVGLASAVCPFGECLLTTSDASGVIIAIGYGGTSSNN